MGKTSIEWTDASWNPIVGCTEISPGCANCYAARLAATRLRNTPQYKGLSERPEGCYARWTGEVRFLQDRLEEPLHWRKPRKIFVCDMGDLFHEKVLDEWIGKIVQMMWRCPQHVFQILTKRPERMKELFSGYTEYTTFFRGNPLPNVWLGVSVENQHFADERIPLLLETPAAVRFVSAEPLLGEVNLRAWPVTRPGIHWVICGGESGANARPMHPDWARWLRDQCEACSIPFFFKQWGEWLHATQMEAAMTATELDLLSKGTLCRDTGSGDLYFKVGKKRAGRLLAGREWNEFPGRP